MLELLKKLSIKIQLLIMVVCTLMIIFLVIFVEHSKISSVMIKANNEYTSEIFSQIKRNISDNSDLIIKMLNSLAYNKVVQDYVVETDALKRYESFGNIDSVFSNMKSVKEEEIRDLIVLGENGTHFFQGGLNSSTMETLEKMPKNERNYFSPMVQLEYGGVEKNCFVVSSAVYSVSGHRSLGTPIGIAAVVLDAKMLSVDSSGILMNASTKFYLFDRNNVQYSTNDKTSAISEEDVNSLFTIALTGKKSAVVNNRKYVINLESIPQTKGKILSVIPTDELLSDVVSIRKLSITILLIGLLLLSIPFAIIINNILQPLNKFMRFTGKVSTGSLKGLKERVQLRGYSEIEMMSDEFNNMLDEIDGLTNRLLTTSTRLYETELDKKQAELAFLKSQINPHFLYNTFESMIGTAFEERAGKTIEMIKALARILKYSIKGADIVRLREELDIVKSYIYIQQVRFVDMFDVKYDIDERTLDCSIPKIILQPIVENAICHGLETKLEYGHLCIGSGFDEQGDLCIWVYDDGVGMEPHVLDQMKKQIAGDMEKSFSQHETTRIGIVNVDSRIKFIYGEDFGIEIHSKQREGTRVRIKLPARRDENVQSYNS